MKHPFRWAAAVAVLVVTAFGLQGCAAGAMTGASFTQAIQGLPGTVRSYTEDSRIIDEIHGTSFAFARDSRFDTNDSEGTSKNDSSVVMISLGNYTMDHVGSTLIFAQDGIVDVGNKLPNNVKVNNTDPGAPWLNMIGERFRNLWQGKAKTIMIRSQNGTPLAVYAGDHVEQFATDIPKSTAFLIDGKYMLVYRADYTVCDTALCAAR